MMNQKEILITLGPDLETEYQSWLEVCKSLEVKKSLSSFLYFYSLYYVPTKENFSTQEN